MAKAGRIIAGWNNGIRNTLGLVAEKEKKKRARVKTCLLANFAPFHVPEMRMPVGETLKMKPNSCFVRKRTNQSHLDQAVFETSHSYCDP